MHSARRDTSEMPELPVMRPIQTPGTTLLLRTSFVDQGRWDSLRAAIETPTPEGFLAGVEVIEQPEYADLTSSQLVALLPAAYQGPTFFLVADSRAVQSPDHPILVVPVPCAAAAAPRPEFRVIATQLWSVENNLAGANMDWQDFMNSTAAGVFRGF